MLTALSLGVAASVAAEVCVWLNKKLSGTVLQGQASFLLALVVSLAVAAGKLYWFTPGFVFDWTTLGTAFAQVWTVAQVFFVLVVQNLKLDVQAK